MSGGSPISGTFQRQASGDGRDLMRPANEGNLPIRVTPTSSCGSQSVGKKQPTLLPCRPGRHTKLERFTFRGQEDWLKSG